ncbi:cytochrome P450 [Aspergillus stella-maris]|uniref:cytochrome P450 n=1 Tax=Aspergillus stella-maris TaxID=1810926 RepID=UPI003CCCA40B
MLTYTTLTTLSATLLFPLCLYKFVIRAYLTTPLSKCGIPNAHFTAPLSHWWMDGVRKSGSETVTIQTLHARHGPVVRLSPDEISVHSLHGLRVIYTGAFEKHSAYRDLFVNYHTDNLVGMIGNKEHGAQKRMLARVYAKSYLSESVDLRTLSGIILGERLLPLLKRVAEKGQVINVLPLFQAVGMDFTSGYLFGSKIGTRYLFDLEGWEKWLAEYEVFKKMSLDERADGFIERWCLELCNRTKTISHHQTQEDSKDEISSTSPIVYSTLRTALEKAPDHKQIDLAIASEFLDHLIAGHETSGITFTYMMWELSKRPEMQEELRRELLTLNIPLIYPSPSSTDKPGDGKITLPHPSTIDALPLLDSILRETLRLHAPAASPLPRVTPHTPTGTSIDGFDNIPGGITVSSSAYTLHRIEEVFPNANEWIPQRWMDPAPEKGKKMDMRRLWWPFGSGGRMCLGSNFAIQEIKLVMAAVYTNYRTEIVDDDQGMEQDFTDFISLPKGRKLLLRFHPVDT